MDSAPFLEHQARVSRCPHPPRARKEVELQLGMFTSPVVADSHKIVVATREIMSVCHSPNRIVSQSR